MGINKRRAALAAGLVLLLTIAGGVVYGLRYRGKEQASSLRAAAENYLKAQNFGAAKIEADKLLRLNAKDGHAHYLKALAFLGQRDMSRIKATDADGMAGVRSLLQAARHDTDLVDAHRRLVPFFLAADNNTEAGLHGDAVLKVDPSDRDSRFAVASNALERSLPQDAAVHVEYLLKEEQPVRPRTAWLAARLGEVTGRKASFEQAANELLDQLSQQKWTAPADLLSLVELRLWRAQRSKTTTEAQQLLQSAISELTAIEANRADNSIGIRQLLKTANKLTINPQTLAPAVASAHQQMQPQVEELIGAIFVHAIADKVLEPTIYIDYANFLRKRNKSEEAVLIVQTGVENAKSAGPEIRIAFALCDLWLSEHYLTQHQGEMAKPHIEFLRTTDRYRPWGQMLDGYRLVQLGEIEQAAGPLSEAVQVLQENGVANALHGLCQLRRGFISQGRQYLEKGIRLGADQPQYKAWLALALAQAGYRQQAESAANDILKDPQTAHLGRALLGQLRMQSGQFKLAEKDLDEAIRLADESSRPALLLAKAELAISQKDFATAQNILKQLKSTPMAPQAIAVEYRQLMANTQADEARKLLKDGREQFPDHTLLLALEARELAASRQFDVAVKLLNEERKRQPTSIVPVLLLSEVHELADDADASIAILSESCDRFPQESALKIRLIEKLLRQKRFTQAGKMLADLKGDARINQASVDYLLALSASLQGDLNKAEGIIQRAAEKDPDNPTLKFLSAQLALKKGKFNDASQMFEQMMTNGAHREQVIRSFFETLLRTGETDRAIELLTQAERQGSSVGSMRGRLLKLLARQDDWEAVEKEMQNLLKENASEGDIALAVSLLRALDQPDRAKKVLDQAIEQNPKSLPLAEQRLALLIDTGKHAAASEVLTDLLQRHPKHGSFHALQAYSLMQQKKWTEALESAEKGWELNPGNAMLVSIRLQILAQQDKHDEARKFADQASLQHQNLPDPNYLLAKSYESVGKADISLTMLKKAVDKDPTNRDAVHQYLRMLADRGLTEDLDSTISKLMVADPENPLLLGVMAERLVAENDIAQADLMLTKLEKVASSSSLVSYLRATVAYARGDLAVAEEALKAALADPKGHIPSNFLLAKIRVSQRRYEDAFALIDQVRKQRPGLATAHMLHLQLLNQVGRVDEAEHTVRELLKKNANNRPFQAVLAQILLGRRDASQREEAARIVLTALKEGVDSSREFERFLDLLAQSGHPDEVKKFVDTATTADKQLACARVLFRNGQFADCSRLVKMVIEQQPKDVEALLLLGDALVRQTGAGDAEFEEAAQLYRNGLKLSPGNLRAANNLAWTLGVRLNKPHRAMEELSLAIPRLRPDDRSFPAELLDTVGVLHLRMEHFADAQSYLEAAIIGLPSNAECHYHLGQCYAQLNRPDRARSSFQNVLKLEPNGSLAKQIKQAGLAN